MFVFSYILIDFICWPHSVDTILGQSSWESSQDGKKGAMELKPKIMTGNQTFLFLLNFDLRNQRDLCQVYACF